MVSPKSFPNPWTAQMQSLEQSWKCFPEYNSYFIASHIGSAWAYTCGSLLQEHRTNYMDDQMMNTQENHYLITSIIIIRPIIEYNKTDKAETTKALQKHVAKRECRAVKYAKPLKQSEQKFDRFAGSCPIPNSIPCSRLSIQHSTQQES